MQLDREYPIDITNLDIDAFRRTIGWIVATMHRSPDAKTGGNAQKKICICIDKIILPDDLVKENEDQHSGDNHDEHTPGLSTTEREYLQKARIGQGDFRNKLLNLFSSKCPVTGIENPDLLIASHIKPWNTCTNKERLEPNNGILLSALLDRLFDKGLITFDSNGSIVGSKTLGYEDRLRCGLENLAQISLSKEAEEYMGYHRLLVFRDRSKLNRHKRQLLDPQFITVNTDQS